MINDLFSAQLISCATQITDPLPVSHSWVEAAHRVAVDVGGGDNLVDAEVQLVDGDDTRYLVIHLATHFTILGGGEDYSFCKI